MKLRVLQPEARGWLIVEVLTERGSALPVRQETLRQRAAMNLLLRRLDENVAVQVPQITFTSPAALSSAKQRGISHLSVLVASQSRSTYNLQPRKRDGLANPHNR